MKKISLIFSVLMIVGMALAACQAATEAPAGTEAPAAANVSGTIRVGSWDSAEALEPFESAIQSFEAKYPDVEVQLESVPQDYGTSY